jgi:molecular chaperone IbpA|tara:strand:+ start:237 stop:683 length:447 start_codon:yes stop_codon:yes gene_type:complete
MVNKQFRITSDTLSPLYKATVGFDRLFNEFENIHTAVNSQGYPPYNISKSLDDDEVYVITLAVAGFKKSEIEIELKEGNLLINGTVENKEESGIEYLHKGIAERDFFRSFKLAEYVEVKSAKLEDGLLKVELFRNVPDALKPQKIKVS